MAMIGKKMVSMEDEEDMDVEALRLAALQTLKKSAVKPEPLANNCIGLGPVTVTPSPIIRQGLRHMRGRGPGSGPRVLRGRGRGNPRTYSNCNNNYQNFHGGNTPGFFQSRPSGNSNLITIVPTVPDQTEVLPTVQPEGVHLKVKQEQPDNGVSVAEQEKVPAKFRRLDDDSDSEESDEESDNGAKTCSDVGESSGDEDNKDNVAADSDNESEKDADVVNLQPEDEGEDSLEQLMRELEEEMNETSVDKKTTPTSSTLKVEKRIKKEKKEKRRKEKVPKTDIDTVAQDVKSLASKGSVPEALRQPSQLPSRSSRSPSPRHAQALKSKSHSPQFKLEKSHSPLRGNSPSGPWSPRKCVSPRRAISPQGIHTLPRGTASSRALSPKEARSPNRSPARSYSNVSPSRRSRSRSRTRSPYRSPRRSPARFPPRLPSPGRLRSRSRSPRRFRSKSRSPMRVGYLRRSRSPRSPSRTLRRSPSPLRRSRSPGGRIYPLRSPSPRGSFKARRSYSPKGRRSPSPYSKKLSPRRRSRSPIWSNSYPRRDSPRRSRSRSRSPLPYVEPYPHPLRRSRSPGPGPVLRRYSPLPPARGYRSPSPSSRGGGGGTVAVLRRRSPIPPAHRPMSPSFRFSPPKSSRRSPSPGRVRLASPGRPRDRDRAPSPMRTRDRPPSPARMRLSPPRARSPRVRERLSPPVRSRDRPLSPVRARDRPLSPARGRERLPSPGRPRERPPSPGRLRERLPSPGRVRDRPASPAKIRERPLSPVAPARHSQRHGSPRKLMRSYQGSRGHTPPSQSVSSPGMERGRSRSESISLSPSPEPQLVHRPHDERSRRKSQPLRDSLSDSKMSRADLRSMLPKRRVVSSEESKIVSASLEEQSKREKRERKKSKKEKKSKKNNSSQGMDPVLEARRRKFESSAPVEVTGKKIRLRNAASELSDGEKMDYNNEEQFDIEKEKERELKEANEIDESILDKELMGGVDLLWSDEEEEADTQSSVQDGVHFKRTFNMDSGSSNTGKENIPEEGSKHSFVEPLSSASSPQIHESSDGDKESVPEDYEDSCDSDREQTSKPEETLPKTNKELKEFILSQAKRKAPTHVPAKLSDTETVKVKSKGSEDTPGYDDLRAELSRRRAERLTKGSTAPDPDTLPRRLLQSALQGVGVKPSSGIGSRKRHRSPCEDNRDKQDSERRRVLVLRRAMEQKAPAINIIIPKAESPTESSSKSSGKVPIHMRLGVGGRGDEDCSSKVKLKRNISVGRKKQV